MSFSKQSLGLFLRGLDRVNFYQSLWGGLLGFFLFLSSPVMSAEIVSIGVVNVRSLMENAPQARNSSAKLKAKFSPTEQALAKQLEEIRQLEEKKNSNEILGSTVKKVQLERDIRIRKRVHSRALEDFREELRFARDTALDKVQQEVYEAIATVRAQRGIDIIIQEYVSASKRVDITDGVLEYLHAKIKKTNRNNGKLKKGNDGNFIPR
ncbi:MAG TPA: OmpH family outer membrane protein [Leucothrix mucor]|nr:OmpH family outer membrane protein [Leucothrix mucor]